MSSGRRSAYRAMYAASTASTWSSTTRSPLLRSAVATARRSSAQSASAGASVSRNAGSAAPSPSRWPIRVSSSVRSASRSRPVLFLYFSVRPSRNSATVAGCGYTSIARRLRPERGLMSRPSRAHTLAPRGRSRNSGLPVFDAVRTGVESREVGVQGGLGGPVPGGVRDDERGVDSHQAVPGDERREGVGDLVVGAGDGDVHEPAPVVQDGQKGGALLAPGEVDSDEMHGPQPAAPGPAAMTSSAGGGPNGGCSSPHPPPSSNPPRSPQPSRASGSPSPTWSPGSTPTGGPPRRSARRGPSATWSRTSP